MRISRRYKKKLLLQELLALSRLRGNSDLFKGSDRFPPDGKWMGKNKREIQRCDCCDDLSVTTARFKLISLRKHKNRLQNRVLEKI